MIELIEFYSRVGYDVEFAVELLEGFVEEDAPMILKELLDAAANGDINLVAASAHNIKGAAQNLSIKTIEIISKNIETIIQSNDFAGLDAEIEKLSNEIVRLKDFIGRDGWAELSPADQDKIPF